MKPCKICEKPIQRRIQIHGRAIILTAKRATCHHCKPYKSGDLGNSRDATRINIEGALPLRQCRHCDKWLGDASYYRSTGFQCKGCILSQRKSKTSVRAKLKLLAVRYKGGKCLGCNGVFSICAYDFHHRDPSQKDFMISSKSSAWNRSIQQELDKCDLLCSNCHRVEHVKHPHYLQTP